MTLSSIVFLFQIYYNLVGYRQNVYQQVTTTDHILCLENDNQNVKENSSKAYSNTKFSQVESSKISKRKVEYDESPVLNKITKIISGDGQVISNDISMIYSFGIPTLNCIARYKRVIVFGGTRGLLQWRNEEVITMSSIGN